MEAPGIWVTTNEEYEGVAQRDRDEADRLSGHAWTQMYHNNRTFMVRLPVQYLHQVLLDAEPISVGTQDGGPWGYVRLPQLHERLSDLRDIAGSAMNQQDHEQATGSMGGRMPSSSATASFDQGSNSHSYGRDPALLAVDQASQTNGMQRKNGKLPLLPLVTISNQSTMQTLAMVVSRSCRTLMTPSTTPITHPMVSYRSTLPLPIHLKSCRQPQGPARSFAEH